MTVQHSLKASLVIFVTHNLWLGTAGFRSIYYERCPESANKIDTALLIGWICLFFVALIPWLLCNVSWWLRVYYLAVSFVAYFILSLIIASFVTRAYMLTVF